MFYVAYFNTSNTKIIYHTWLWLASSSLSTIEDAAEAAERTVVATVDAPDETIFK